MVNYKGFNYGTQEKRGIRVIGYFVLIQRAMELVFNWPHRPLKLFEKTLRVDKTC